MVFKRVSFVESTVITVAGDHLTQVSDESRPSVACRVLYNETYTGNNTIRS